MRKIALFLFPFFLLFYSCSIITFDDDDAESMPGMSVSWFDGEYVCFLFSCEVMHYYAEESVTLKSGISQFSTEKTWLGNILLIKPVEGWKKGCVYQAVLSGTMYRPSGNVFPVYASANFTYGNTSDAFHPLSLPESQKDCGTDFSFTFAFNKEISRVSFEESFSISPSCEYRIETDSTRKVFTVYPKSKWAVSTFYTWKIKALNSLDNWELQDVLSGSFETMHDYDYPVLTKICAVSDLSENAIWFEDGNLDGCVSGKMPLGFIFSKPMSFESVKGAVSISPQIDGYFLQADSDGKKFLFVPEKFYKLKKKYVVKVSTDAKDMNDLRLFRDFSESFTSADDYLELVSLKLDTEDVADLGVSSVSHHLPQSGSMTVMLEFSRPFDEENLYSVAKAVSLSLLFPMSSKTPVQTEILWNVNRDVITLTYTNLSVKTSDQTTYYALKIKGGESGVNTGTGLYLKEDICVNIQPE